MDGDKRRFVRKRTDQLVYAEVGPDNGSILLNLCEDGCSFQSIAPVRGEQVRFSVSVGDGRKLEGDGRMVWSDPAKKTGGLHFVNPSQELREQVREWLQETLVTADGRIDRAVLETQAKRRRKQLREEAKAELKRREEARQALQAETEVAARVEAQALAMANATPSTVGWTENPLRFDEHKPTATWRGLGTMALVAVLLMAAVGYRRELGYFVMTIGSSLAGDSQKADTQADQKSEKPGASGAVEAAPSNPPAAEAAHTTTPDEQDTRPTEENLESGSNPPAVVAKPVSMTAAQSSGAGKRTAVPTGEPGAAGTPAAEEVPTLWNLVENGDTRAEVALARRYVKGDGVPQSCAQARVLLEAAVKRGSAEGRQKLDELGQSGCP